MIEKILPATEAKLRIAKTIYENPGISINRIIKTARVSPNLAVKYVNDLVSFNVISYQRQNQELKKNT